MSARRWGVVLLVGALGWVGLGGGARAQLLGAPKPVAVVNGQPIPLAELELAMKQAGQAAAAPTETARREVREQVLAHLIDETIMQQWLRKTCPPVPAAEVQKELDDLKLVQQRQGHTVEDFLRETGQTEAQLRSRIASRHQWLAYVRPYLNDGTLQAYYQTNKDFFDGVQVRISHILLRVPRTASEAERQAARNRLQALRQEILGGKVDFAAAARSQSQCSSAPQGGDIGFIARKWMVEEPIAAAAFAMKTGEVSDVVQTEFGFHLIKVTDRKPGQPSDFTKIKEDVSDIMVDDMLQTTMDRERKAARVDIRYDLIGGK